MRDYVRFRSAHAGLWLLAALAATLVTYTGEARADAAQPWLFLDLFLAYRIWHRGRISLRLFRFLQAFGTSIYGLAVISVLVQGDFHDLSYTWLVVPFAISLWCSFAPAISVHVFGPAARARMDFPSTAPRSRLSA